MTNSYQGDIEWVTSDIIREEFNKCQYYERVLRGELNKKVISYDNHLSRYQRKKAEEPKCTRSQMLLYSSLDGKPLAIVHQYRRKDGSLGGSGRPDPKKLIFSNKTLAVKQTD